MGETISCALCKKPFEPHYKNSRLNLSDNICKQCTLKEYGPSYEDIRNCNHMHMSLEENKRLLKKNSSHSCECEFGERGWTDPSGKRTLVPGVKSVVRKSKKGNIYTTNQFFMQSKIVHTNRWDNIKQLKKKHGNKARSSLRISKEVIKILKSTPGPHRKGGRKNDNESDRREFIIPPLGDTEKPKWTGKLLKGNPPYGTAHSIRRQIFLLFHADPKYLRKLLFDYDSSLLFKLGLKKEGFVTHISKSERDLIDEIRGEEKHLVTVWLPILERATDELIDEILNCERNNKITKEDLLGFHPLLKDKKKWRYTLCRLVELRRIDEYRKKTIKQKT